MDIKGHNFSKVKSSNTLYEKGIVSTDLQCKNCNLFIDEFGTVLKKLKNTRYTSLTKTTVENDTLNCNDYIIKNLLE